MSTSMKHRHKWKWIVKGYMKECIVCGKREYYHQRLRKDKDVQYLEGGFPI